MTTNKVSRKKMIAYNRKIAKDIQHQVYRTTEKKELKAKAKLLKH